MLLRKKKNYILIDANILVAFIDEKDVHHQQAKEIIFSISENSEFVILFPILGEAYSVIARRCKERKYDCQKALRLLRELEKLFRKETPSADFHQKTVENMINSPELSYNDWLLITYSLSTGLDIVSFDLRLVQKLKELRK